VFPRTPFYKLLCSIYFISDVLLFNLRNTRLLLTNT